MRFVVDVVKRGCKGINHGRLGVIPFRPWILTTSLRFVMPLPNVAFVDGDFDPEEQRQLTEQLSQPELDLFRIWAEALRLNCDLMNSSRDSAQG